MPFRGVVWFLGGGLAIPQDADSGLFQSADAVEQRRFMTVGDVQQKHDLSNITGSNADRLPHGAILPVQIQKHPDRIDVGLIDGRFRAGCAALNT